MFGAYVFMCVCNCRPVSHPAVAMELVCVLVQPGLKRQLSTPRGFTLLRSRSVCSFLKSSTWGEKPGTRRHRSPAVLLFGVVVCVLVHVCLFVLEECI